MNIYNARLCNKMAGFIVDAALIFILQNISQKFDYNNWNSAWGCAEPEASSSQELLLQCSQPGIPQHYWKPKLHGLISTVYAWKTAPAISSSWDKKHIRHDVNLYIHKWKG